MIRKDVEVVRNEGGYYLHPDIPQDGWSPSGWAKWLVENELQVRYRFLSDDDRPEAQAILDRYDKGDNLCLKQWEPVAPVHGEWFLLYIGDSDEGPLATWARHFVK